MSYSNDQPRHGDAPPQDAAGVAPLPETLLGRLVVVPALIVCVMLGVAVVVVLFGASPLDKPQTIDQLLATIESDSGQRTAGVALMPAAKESWQAAQELARRLEKIGSDPEMTPKRRDELSARIVTILDGAMKSAAPGDVTRNKCNFLAMALSMLEAPSGVEWLVERLSSDDADARRVALQGLARMRSSPAARGALPRIYPLLRDASREVQMVACLTVASLAEKGDAAAIRELATLEAPHVELQWNKAVALTRLGSPRGKLMLLNMLDRGYWQGQQLDYFEGGTHILRRFTETEVSNRLAAAAEVAVHLDDGEVRAVLEKLRDADPSHEVRKAAQRSLQGEAGERPDAHPTASDRV